MISYKILPMKCFFLKTDLDLVSIEEMQYLQCGELLKPGQISIPNYRNVIEPQIPGKKTTNMKKQPEVLKWKTRSLLFLYLFRLRD